MYNYSITYKDLSIAGTFFKGCNINADDIMDVISPSINCIPQDSFTV